jgi:hypothetical protein
MCTTKWTHTHNLATCYCNTEPSMLFPTVSAMYLQSVNFCFICFLHLFLSYRFMLYSIAGNKNCYFFIIPLLIHGVFSIDWTLLWTLLINDRDTSFNNKLATVVIVRLYRIPSQIVMFLANCQIINAHN